MKPLPSRMLVILGSLFGILASIILITGSEARTALAVSAAPLAGRNSGVSVTASHVRVAIHTSLDGAWARQVATGEWHTCALTGGGGVKCWGDNSRGQLGDGTTEGYATPFNVVGLNSGVEAVAVGGEHSCAIMAGGGVKCWGNNDHGQLGIGTLGGAALTPVDVIGLTSGVRALSAGNAHTCALTVSGAVKCWGANIYGQLGNGMSVGGQTTPVDVVGLDSGVQMISAGYSHTCALTGNGEAKCWGYNYNGEVGDGTGYPGNTRLTPVDVVGLTSDTRAISAGDAHTCAVVHSGNIKCWGANSLGQLGDGTTAAHPTPVDVIGLTDAVVILSAGGYHNCAILTDGGIKCWGDNTEGQLGDGTTTRRLTAVDVTGLDNEVAAISAGYRHTCALTAVGGVKCWGLNNGGQLGDGTTATRLTPVDVLMLVFDCAGVTEIPQRECAALLAFFDSTHGLLWSSRTGWLQTVTPCAWQGVTCVAAGREDAGLAAQPSTLCNVPTASCPPRRVSQLALPNNRLHGVLPPELGDLAFLQTLDLNGNDYTLAGPLPAELGNLAALQTLDLSGNRFSGPLPPELGNLAALQILDLGSNRFSGPLPPELGRLAALQELDLAENAFTQLPAELGDLANLHRLDLRHAVHGVTVPPELGRLAALQELDLSYNGLTGSLPPELGDLGALQSLSLGFNRLSGALPPELGHLAALQSIDAPQNQLSGSLPPELGKLTALQDLRLSYNQLSGGLPAEWGRLTALQHLDLARNQLSGPLPNAWGNLAALRYLDLSVNQLSGPLPPELGNLAALGDLYLDHNQLSGSIPPELGNLTGIQARWRASEASSPARPVPPYGYLFLASNRLSGPIPVELSKLSAAAGITLDGNQLSGPLPPEVGAALRGMYLANVDCNMLTGYDPYQYPYWYWNETQTVPPTDLRAAADASDTVALTWTPIAYIGDGGFYEISYATAANGPFTVHGHTTDKTIGSYTVTGLTPGVTTYFRVRTFTPAHKTSQCDQPNDLWSDYSVVISAGGTPTPSMTSTPTVTVTPAASPTVTLTPTVTATATPTPIRRWLPLIRQ